MATITLKYNARQPISKKLLEILLTTGCFQVEEKESTKEDNYDFEFVKMVKDSHKQRSIATLSTKRQINSFLGL